MVVLTVNKEGAVERELRSMLAQQSALLDVAQEAILVCDLSGYVLYWNKGAERLYGWAADEVLGRRADKLFLPDSAPQLQVALREVLAHDAWRGELHQVAKDGCEIIVESRWTLVRDEAGQPFAKLVVNTDITERKRLETELLRASQLSFVGELAAGLAHEIKNPLAGIKGAVDILIQRRSPADPEVAVLADVRHAVGQIDQTVSALLERARPRPPRLAETALDEVVRRAVLLARHHAAKAAATGRRIESTFVPPPQPLVMACDAAQIEDAVLNLVINGVEAIEGDGQVTVSIRRQRALDAQDEAIIEVTDNGRGIAEEDRTRIFNPFYTTTKGGTGLGLPAVRRIAHAHGGRVEVHSKLGRGSTFAVCLPISAKQA
jgi:two-component system, cell cycle sensor histidine kinase and response regulator CckA